VLFKKLTIFEYERGLKYVDGRFVGILEPGQFWIFTPRTTVRKVDIRPKFVSVPGQEVISSDGVSVKVSIAVAYQYKDLDVAINRIENHFQALYQALQLSLRRIVGNTEIDDLLANRAQLGGMLYEQATNEVEEYGLELLQVDLKDLMFPGDLKKTFAQVVNARKEGLATLEKARGETAALRNLSNAARMMEDSPMLLQLRLLQQLAGSTGNTVVLGIPSSSTPLPVKEPHRRESLETPEDQAPESE
jgi:regulator of protease activity HflC (stomatin/prohibitin superfamily)